MKKFKYTKEQVGFIKKAKKQIQDLENKQTKIYTDLLESINLEPETEKEEYLFDFVYNDFGKI